MVAWKRFPVPEFDYAQFKAIAYKKPIFVSTADVAAKADRAAGEAFAMALDPDLAKRFGFSGDHMHAVAVTVPARGGRLIGRSHAWKVQRALVLRGFGATAPIAADWRTPRPMNTRLGPEDGIDLDGGTYVVVCGSKYADGWTANRTIVQGSLTTGEGRSGLRVLSAADPDVDDFHDTCLIFDWPK